MIAAQVVALPSQLREFGWPNGLNAMQFHMCMSTLRLGSVQCKDGAVKKYTSPHPHGVVGLLFPLPEARWGYLPACK